MALPTAVRYEMPTEFPQNRVDWTLDPSRAVLLLHDMQEYFVNAYDRSVDPLQTVVPNIDRLRSSARAAGIPIVYTAQPGDQDPEERALLSDFWGPGLKADPAHTDVIAELAPHPEDVMLTKWRYSAFIKTDLRERLRESGRDQLIITGIYAHIGCLTTALDGFMQDVQIFFVGDAVADFSLDEHVGALEYAAGRCASVTRTDDLVKAMSSETVSA
ncbi:isochorismatase family protein [Rhodococcus sp. NPDC057135]|uniref:isochorismatase family protein n=1 Tax=unclassified Rhodococcus (in: high G+C Gram-positive bacteria) TaxID=192944 RepID=UPI003641C04C